MNPLKNLKTVKIIAFFILFIALHSSFANEIKNAQTSYCLRCHGMETLAYRDTVTGEKVNLYVNFQQYQQSNHKQLECIACHTANYSEYPHPDNVKQEKLYCPDCHQEDSKLIHYQFAEIEQAFNSSVHAIESPQQLTCFSCHDSHQFKISRVGEKITDIIRYNNEICFNCHASSVNTQLKGYTELLISHQWLPNLMRHWQSVRCIECHTPATARFSHQILPAKQSVKNCVSCHSKEATLLTRLYQYRSQKDLQTTGWFNKAVFNQAYIIGLSRNETIDRWSLIILGLTIIGLLAHGLGRFLTNKIRSNHFMKPLYLYPLWIRLWHWSNALLFIILIMSGASLHYANAHHFLAFDTLILVHNTAGILLTISWLCFFIGNFFTENGKHYRIKLRGMIARLIKQSRYYAIGIFKGEPHPFHVSTEMKFNTLQQLSYIGIMYGLMPILIMSGLLFLFPGYLPDKLMDIGSIWIVAMTHLLVAYLLILFMLSHIYIITTGGTIFSNLQAMITGWHKEKHYE
jgi:thiosulfate reductase cytochrome b subunit